MWRDCTIREAKTKALISFAITAKLICIFAFAYAKCRFSHDAAHLVSSNRGSIILMTMLWQPEREYMEFYATCSLFLLYAEVNNSIP